MKGNIWTSVENIKGNFLTKTIDIFPKFCYIKNSGKYNFSNKVGGLHLEKNK